MDYKLIMVVDDSTSARQFIADTLKMAGYNIVEAIDGKDAMLKLMTTSVNMIITDLYMPNIDGIELIRKIRKTERYKTTPIIMYTVESEKKKVVEAITSGVTAWMLKPGTPEQILQTTRKILG